jgi:hypothetical protein
MIGKAMPKNGREDRMKRGYAAQWKGRYDVVVLYCSIVGKADSIV